jgi:hypothetical protein
MTDHLEPTTAPCAFCGKYLVPRQCQHTQAECYTRLGPVYECPNCHVEQIVPLKPDPKVEE